jgi:hypothetical protein
MGSGVKSIGISGLGAQTSVSSDSAVTTVQIGETTLADQSAIAIVAASEPILHRSVRVCQEGILSWDLSLGYRWS